MAQILTHCLVSSPHFKKKVTKIRDVQLSITRLLKTPAPLVITIKYFQAVFKGISEIK